MPRWSFLSNQAIRDTMFVDGDSKWLEAQTNYLQRRLGSSYDRMTLEDALGAPKLIHGTKTSHNTIHHLYHIYYYLETTSTKLKSINTVVEWGGGYGNLAKLWMRNVKPNSTYIIIDTALFCSIQSLYLGCIFGTKQINLLDKKSVGIVKGKINLVPLALLNSKNIEGDLFVSTWGLSESSAEAQDFVIRQHWFNAKHVLLGFQKSTSDLYSASRLGDLARKNGITVSEIPFIKGNYYGFK